MKRKVFLICVLLIVSMMVASNYKYLKHEEQEHKIKESNIAIMVYDDEINNYVKQSNVPKGAKYSLNEELTKCEAGGQVTNYNKVNGTLKYVLPQMDYCYVYFDVDNTPAYAIYSETDNSLIFYKNNDTVTKGTEYNGRVVTDKYTGFEDTIYERVSSVVGSAVNTPWYEYASAIKTVSVVNEITPISTACWFYYLQKAESIDLTNLNTKYVINMERMFDGAGEFSSSFVLNLGSKFDTSNVTNMYVMFQYAGYNAKNFQLNLGDKFDTSNVTNMNGMFYHCGYFSNELVLDLGNKFNTSNVTDMSQMFSSAGYSNPNFQLKLGNKFDTSKVTDMIAMFEKTGYNSKILTLDLGDKFNTSKVENMQGLFHCLGYESEVFEINLGSNFDTSNVKHLDGVFRYLGHKNSKFTLNLGDKFKTHNATSMNRMFQFTGLTNPNFELDLSGFVVSSKCNLTEFIQYSAKKIILGEGWSNATLVSNMFLYNNSTPIEIVNAPANIQAYNFASDNRVPTFTTI